MTAREVRDRLRTELRARLEPLGWQALDVADGGLRLAAFRRRVDGEFTATGEVSGAFRTPDRPPVPVTAVFVGVSYEPLRRLSPLLDRFDLAVLHDHVWPRDDEELEVATVDDAEHAAERLAALIVERAAPFAERHASVEALIAEAAPLTSAALLAAAGRFADARDALAQVEPPARSRLARRDRRTLHQLRRWIDSGGDPALIPAAPPPSSSRKARDTSFAEVRAQSRAEHAALDEVRDRARSASREEARAQLRAALARHGAPERSPLWMETRLDHLWDSRGEQAELAVKFLKGAARLGLGVAKAIRDRELPDLSPPDWLEPPDHALYEVPRSDRWIAVELSPEAGPWLDRVYDAARHPFGFVTLTAWLRGSDVHLGEERVGRVPDADAAAYAGVLADAAARDEHPCLEAHLARRAGGYLLELMRP